MAEINIGKRKALKQGLGLSFEMPDLTLSKRARKKAKEEGTLKQGFVVEFKNKLHAYENRCPHLGVVLEMVPGEFFDEDQKYLVCTSHGAMFEPDTGKCISGPCLGDGLSPLEIKERNSDLIITTP